MSSQICYSRGIKSMTFLVRSKTIFNYDSLRDNCKNHFFYYCPATGGYNMRKKGNIMRECCLLRRYQPTANRKILPKIIIITVDICYISVDLLMYLICNQLRFIFVILVTGLELRSCVTTENNNDCCQTTIDVISGIKIFTCIIK